MDRSETPTGSVASGNGARTFAARALAALLCALPVAVAWATPAQVPLLSRTENPAKPNVMFTFDDSGSMSWRFMPDSVGANIVGADNDRYYMTFHHLDDTTFGNATGGTVRLIPTRPSTRSSTGAVCTTDTQFTDCRASDLISARARSSAFNSVYYNPEIYYEPWSNSDGTLFPFSTSTVAWLDPMNRTVAESVNLEGTTNVPYGTVLCRSATTTAPNVTTTADRNRASATCAALPAYTHTNATCTIAGGTWSSPECRFTSTQGATSANCTGTFGGSSYSSSTCRVTTMNLAFCQNRVGGTWVSATSSCEQAAEVLSPATYYQYLGGDTALSTNYQRIRIMDYTSFTRGSNRTDCSVTAGVATKWRHGT